MLAAVMLAVAAVAALLGSSSGRQALGIGHERDRQALEERVRSAMKDPESVQFRNGDIHFAYQGARPVLCGEVNARNSFGGYVGFRRFVATLSGEPLVEDEPTPEFQIVWTQMCKDG